MAEGGFEPANPEVTSSEVKEVTELNGKVQFSSKVHFFGEL